MRTIDKITRVGENIGVSDKRDYAFVFSDNIEDWQTNRAKRSKRSKRESDREAKRMKRPK